MKGILAIFKKELARFFGDKRMVISILMPGILLYVVYSFMGSSLMGSVTTDENFIPVVAVNEIPASLEPALIQFDLLRINDGEDAKEFLSNETAHVAILFPMDFAETVATYEVEQGGAPQVELFYDTSSVDSLTAYNMVLAVLDGYETSLANKFDVVGWDTASEDSTTVQIFSMILPMLLMTFLHSGCMAVAPESIAGEKERGTIATLLITPVGRRHIALGKILALSLIALMAGASNALGTILSLPKLMGDAVSGSIYGIREYVLLAVVILTTVLLMITAISLISAFAKSVKEAATMTAPLMVLVMFLGVMGMAGLGSADSYALYLIPLYNSSQAMASILSFGDVGLPVLLTAFSNLLFTVGGVWLLTKLFRSEKILFKI